MTNHKLYRVIVSFQVRDEHGHLAGEVSVLDSEDEAKPQRFPFCKTCNESECEHVVMLAKKLLPFFTKYTKPVYYEMSQNDE